MSLINPSSSSSSSPLRRPTTPSVPSKSSPSDYDQIIHAVFPARVSERIGTAFGNLVLSPQNYSTGDRTRDLQILAEYVRSPDVDKIIQNMSRLRVDDSLLNNAINAVKQAGSLKSSSSSSSSSAVKISSTLTTSPAVSSRSAADLERLQAQEFEQQRALLLRLRDCNADLLAIALILYPTNLDDSRDRSEFFSSKKNNFVDPQSDIRGETLYMWWKVMIKEKRTCKDLFSKIGDLLEKFAKHKSLSKSDKSLIDGVNNLLDGLKFNLPLPMNKKEERETLKKIEEVQDLCERIIDKITRLPPSPPKKLEAEDHRAFLREIEVCQDAYAMAKVVLKETFPSDTTERDPFVVKRIINAITHHIEELKEHALHKRDIALLQKLIEKLNLLRRGLPPKVLETLNRTIKTCQEMIEVIKIQPPIVHLPLPSNILAAASPLFNYEEFVELQSLAHATVPLTQRILEIFRQIPTTEGIEAIAAILKKHDDDNTLREPEKSISWNSAVQALLAQMPGDPSSQQFFLWKLKQHYPSETFTAFVTRVGDRLKSDLLTSLQLTKEELELMNNSIRTGSPILESYLIHYLSGQECHLSLDILCQMLLPENLSLLLVLGPIWKTAIAESSEISLTGKELSESSPKETAFVDQVAMIPIKRLICAMAEQSHGFSQLLAVLMFVFKNHNISSTEAMARICSWLPWTNLREFSSFLLLGDPRPDKQAVCREMLMRCPQVRAVGWRNSDMPFTLLDFCRTIASEPACAKNLTTISLDLETNPTMSNDEFIHVFALLSDREKFPSLSRLYLNFRRELNFTSVSLPQLDYLYITTSQFDSTLLPTLSNVRQLETWLYGGKSLLLLLQSHHLKNLQTLILDYYENDVDTKREIQEVFRDQESLKKNGIIHIGEDMYQLPNKEGLISIKLKNLWYPNAPLISPSELQPD